MMCGRDIFWHDYKRYGYSEEDFEDNVVADAEWEEVIEPMELPENIERNCGKSHK